MAGIALQNATSRRAGWPGGGGGVPLTPGTDNHFPYWLAGTLTTISQLRNSAGDLLFTRAGAAALYKVQTQTTGLEARVILENSADATSATIGLNPVTSKLFITGPNIDISAISGTQRVDIAGLVVNLVAGGLANIALSATQAVLTGGNFTVTRAGAVDTTVTIENGTTARLCSIVLSNSADVRAAQLIFTPAINKLTVGAANTDITATTIARLVGGVVYVLETTGNSYLYLSGNLLTYTGGNARFVRNDLAADMVFTIEQATVGLNSTVLILKAGLNQAVWTFANNTNFITPGYYSGTAANENRAVGTPASMWLNPWGASLGYTVDPSGFIWYGAGASPIVFVSPNGYSIIGGSQADIVGLGLPYSMLALKGTTNSFCRVYTTAALSTGESRVSADDPTKYIELFAWGSGVGGFVIGAVPSLRAGALTAYNYDNLVIYTNNTGAAFSPIHIGQSASGGSRVLLTYDASGNTVRNASFPEYYGDVAVDGSHRVIITGGELLIEKRVAGSYVSDVGTFQVIATGTGYTLTTTYALVGFGTTSPSITITRPGTYLVIARGAVQSVSSGSFLGKTGPGWWFKIYRSNNAPADQTESFTSSQADDYATDLTVISGMLCPPAVYTTANTTDILQVWGKLQTTTAAGSFRVYACSITAIRLR